MSTPSAKRQPVPFGKYLLLDRVNIGGMAEVWRAKQFGAAGFERLVAIKRILPNIAEDEEFITMFKDEAKISVQLNHANIAQTYELEQIGNNYYIAMEYISGRDMRALFDRCRKKGEPAPVPMVCFCISKVCEGLDYAHRKKDNSGRDLNIVHRDISPQNLLISYEGEVKVIDFGIAKAATKATKTQAGILKGKFGYMSPEQIRGLPLDRRSDIFAIGVCLYEMLTGERLFVGDSDFSVLEKVRKAEVTPPSTYNKRIPESLERIVLKALARDVEERYQYANELGDDLQRFLITNDAIFSRKDLMQYMKSTFAEDVERERQRLMEYAEIKPPAGMKAALEMGYGGGQPQARPSATTPPAVEALPAQPAASRRAPPPVLPKVTPPAPPPQADEETSATVMVKGNEYFDMDAEPATQPGMKTLAPMPAMAAAPEVRAPASRPTPAPVGVVRAPVLTPVGGEFQRPSGRPGLEGPGTRPTPAAVPARPPPQALRPAPRPVLEPEPIEDEVTDPRATSRPVAQGSKLPLLLGVLALLVALGCAAVWLMEPRQPPLGFLFIELPAELRGKVRVNINGEDLGMLTAQQWPLLKQVPAGPAAVLVTAEGYERFSRVVTVVAGQQLDVRAQLEPERKAMRQPSEAPPREAPAPQGDVQPARAEPQEDRYKVQLESEPANATILAEGKELGTTPATLELPKALRQVTLRLKCYDEVRVDVSPEAERPPAKVVLKKQRNCR